MSDGFFQSAVPAGEWEPADLDASVAHSARVYNYWLGGKDNFEVDRAAGDQVRAAYPGIIEGVRAQRAFLARAVRYLAERGIRQFLDIGTGIPSANNTHEVAQSVAPESRVVYVDNDPMVLAHARALLKGSAGNTAYLDADLRDTAAILRDAARLLDFSQPIGLILIGVLQLIPDEDQPYAIVERLLETMPPGSWMAIMHPANDLNREQMAAAVGKLNKVMSAKTTLRGYTEIARFFSGLELIDPGIVPVNQWRPGSVADTGWQAAAHCGLGRKP